METDNFNEIIKVHQQKIYAVVFAMVRNEADTDEIVQQTFISAFKGLKKFRSESSIETWLVKIALNNTRTYFRKGKFLSFFYDNEGKAADIKDETQNTEKAAENEAVKKGVAKAIAKLPFRQKEVFVMKHLNSFSIKEISQVLNIAQGSVKANIFKAIKNLQKHLEDFNEVQ
ncbi:MAG: sigma-70 family RNA polymerase sigma factor [Elusimicrobiota bacterium]|nr:sigma-70 family RNA polymerase sigma factor [Elusimicrobiota bacterium]